jgi:tripeptidyl-peptidase-1
VRTTINPQTVAFLIRFPASHARYGQHLTKEQVEAFIAPHPTTLTAVESWLESHGFDLVSATRSSAKDWITFSVPVHIAEQLLNTTYSVWNHVGGDSIVRTTYYSLPEHLHEHIDVIQPTTSFGLFKPQHVTSFFEEEIPALVDTTTQVISSTVGTTVNASCNTTITPQCLYQLYDIDYNGTLGTGNSIATANYL